MTRIGLIFLMLVVLTIPLFLSDGCGAGPASSAAATSTVDLTSIAPPGSSQLKTTPVAPASIPAISVQDASSLIQSNKNNPDFIIIDVRTPGEFNGGHLANAINIDYYSPDFKSSVDKLERNKEYLLYCQTGIRAAAATRIMLDMGFARLHNLSGGMVEWTGAGYPTVK